MKRFKNILAIYALNTEAEETIRRGVDLAKRNNAILNILHVVKERENTPDILRQRRKQIEHLCDGFETDDDWLQIHVRSGNKLDEILSCVSDHGIDLIVIPSEHNHEIAELFDADLLSKLLRETFCPVWVVRPGEALHYRRVLAAVNAGKENALSCPVNKHVLDIASSLAKTENAHLYAAYVWEHNTHDKESLASELPDEVRLEINETAQKHATRQLDDLLTHMLDDPSAAEAIIMHGNVDDALCACIKDIRADIIVVEGTPDILLLDALFGNRSLDILHHAKCSVFFSRG